MHKRLSAIKLSIFALSLILLAKGTLLAEVIKPIQILLPGNLQGGLISISEDQEPKASNGFKLPYAINAYLDHKEMDSLIFGTGNNSSAFTPVSFLTQGKLERELINRCGPISTAISPSDLEVFNNSNLDKSILNNIFTNVEADYGKELFNRGLFINLKGRHFYFFNFIAPDYCSKLPLNKWSEIRVDDPCRSLRKINPKLTDKDYTLSVVYGDLSCFNELGKELENYPGMHFLVNVPKDNEDPLFSTFKPEMVSQRVFRFSVASGLKAMPILSIFPKNSGLARTTLRMLPLKNYSAMRPDINSLIEKDFKEAWNSVRLDFHKVVKVIPVENRPSTSANLISSQAHAEMLKYGANCHIAFLKPPKQIAFTENTLTLGASISRFPNERIIKFKATELQLRDMFEKMFIDGSIKDYAFAGCQVAALGGEPWKFRINRYSIGNKKLYSVAITESTAKAPIVANLLKSCIIEEYEGLTLWEIWEENLESFPANDEKLFN